MTHLLLETEGATVLLSVGWDVEFLIIVVVELLVVAGLVVVGPSPLLFAGRIPLVVSLSVEFNGGHPC